MRGHSRRLWWALLLPAALAAAESRLHLKSRPVQTVEDPSEYLAAAPKRRTGTRSPFLVQFTAPPGSSELAELRRRGLTPLQYVPESAVLVAGEDNPRLEGLALRWAGRLRFYDKVSPLLVEAASSEARTALYVVEFHPDVEPAEAQALVREHLLEIRPHPDVRPNHLLVEGLPQQVARLAEWEEVAYIFPASEDLAQGLHVNACWGAETPAGLVGDYIAHVGDGWDGPGRNPVALSYFLQRLSSKFPEAAARSEILRALNEWAKYIQLTWSSAAHEAELRSVNILFATGAHGDPYPFDGRGRVLAHTFYPAPPNPEPIAGDIHLDDDENWAIGADTDLFTVVLHELGHALGLGHADKPGSVMYPYYRRATALTAEDISAVRDLYAARDPATETPPATPPATPAPTPPQDPTPTPPTSPTPTPPTSPTPTPPATPPSTPAAPRDTVAPTLVVTSPASANVLTYATTITLRGTASDNVCVVEVGWSDSTGASGTAQGTTNWTTGELPLREGTNTFTVRARDAAGNVGWRSVVVTRRKR